MMRKKLAIFIVMLISIFGTAVIANASTTASEYISVYYGEVIDYGNGNLAVDYSITGTGIMNKIGAKTVLLQERDNPFDEWRTIATYSYLSDSDMLASNKGSHMYTLYYDDADTDTYEYRAKIYFYSEKGGYDTREYITDII